MAGEDWTAGPAKWAAVVVLGGASIFGIAWSAVTRSPHPSGAVRAATPVVPDQQEVEEAPRPAAAAVIPAPAERARPSPPPSTIASRININSATAAELELLPSIGPALASRIIEYRTSNGPFRTVDELDEVKGIGPRIMEKLRPLVRIE